MRLLSPLLSSALIAPTARWASLMRPAALAGHGHQRHRALVVVSALPPGSKPSGFDIKDDEDDADAVDFTLPADFSLPDGWEPPPGFVNIEDDGDDDVPDFAAAAQPWLPLESPRRASPPPPQARAATELEAELTVPRGVCSGCGARFQSTDEAAPGFAPDHVLDARSTPVCQRCHGLRYQNRLPTDALRVSSDDAAHIELQPAHFLDMLKTVGRQRCLVVAIVDLFDFHGSLVPDLSRVIGADNNLILVGNKFDLLPPTVNARMVEQWVRAESRRARLPPLQSVHLVSCKSGVGLPKLLDDIHAQMGRRRLDCYVIGAANAGKSSFINHCLRRANTGGGKRGGQRGREQRGSSSSTPSAAVEQRMLTTSHLPGTTLGFVRVSVFAGRQSLYDTPGVILPNQLTTKLTTEELALVVPKKRAEHVTLRVSEGKCIMLGGIARVHMRAGRPFLFTFYLANAVKIHPTDSSKVEEMLQKHVGGMLAPPASRERLDELGAFEETTFEVQGRGWDDAAIDLVLPGLGWVAITGCGPCTVSVELPDSVQAIGREPLIPSEGGKGARRSQVKFTGSKLRDSKGRMKRVR